MGKIVQILILTSCFGELLFTPLFAQHVNLQTDTITVQQGYKIVFEDTTFMIERDTLLFIPQGKDYKLRKESEYRTNSTYKQISKIGNRNFFLKGIYDLVIREPEDTTETKIKQVKENYHPELDKKQIGSITIIPVQIITGNVNNPFLVVDERYSKIINKLHKDTRQSIVRKNIKIKEGDTLGAYTLSDAEYHLRSLGYFEDVRIFVLPDSLNPSRVNIQIITKDKIPYDASIGTGGVKDLEVGVRNINILGTGIEYSNLLHYNGKNDPYLGYAGKLLIRNAFQSFMDTRFLYILNPTEENLGLKINKEFISPETKYGGALELYEQRTYLNYNLNDSTNISIPYTCNYYDQWLGRSFLLNQVNRMNFIVKARYMLTRYQIQSEFADTNQQYINQNLWLGSISLLKKNYFRERLLVGFGLPEDVDCGYSFELTGGYQSTRFFQAPYLGLQASAAKRYSFGFLSAAIEYGGILYKQQISHGLFRFTLGAYSPLLNVLGFPMRLLSKVIYTEGIRRFTYENLNIGDEVRGISDAGISGNKKVACRFELVSFLKGNFLGFRFSPNLFYDGVFISNKTALISSTNYYSGFGIGARIRNEHLTFQTIILRLAYYPSTAASGGRFGYGITSSFPGSFSEYKIDKPDILKY